MTASKAKSADREMSAQAAGQLMEALTELVARAAAATLATSYSEVAQRAASRTTNPR